MYISLFDIDYKIDHKWVFSLIVRSSHHKGEIVAIAAFHFSFEHWENVCCVFHMIFRH